MLPAAMTVYISAIFEQSEISSTLFCYVRFKIRTSTAYYVIHCRRYGCRFHLASVAAADVFSGIFHFLQFPLFPFSAPSSRHFSAWFVLGLHYEIT